MLTTCPETGTQMNANYSVIFAHGKVGNDVAAKLTSATAKISIGFQSLAWQLMWLLVCSSIQEKNTEAAQISL